MKGEKEKIEKKNEFLQAALINQSEIQISIEKMSKINMCFKKVKFIKNNIVLQEKTKIKEIFIIKKGEI